MTEEKTILLIDDSVHAHKLVEYHLRKDGFEVLLASNGEMGIQIAEKEKPDVILLDLMMPDMTGFEVLQKLKESNETKEIPVFVFSVRNMAADIESAYQLGTDDYITKPITPATLGGIVREKMSAHAQKKEPTSFAGSELSE